MVGLRGRVPRCGQRSRVCSVSRLRSVAGSSAIPRDTLHTLRADARQYLARSHSAGHATPCPPFGARHPLGATAPRGER